MSTFSVIDYLVLGAYLAGMVIIGALFSRRQKSLKEYYHAGGNMPWWAVGISLFATLLSPISYLAGPGWVFGRGFFDPDGPGPAEPYGRLFTIQVPEPSSIGLLAIGALAGLWFSLFRRRR